MTEPLRVWFAASPFRLEAPLATVGTAGETDGRPFWLVAEAGWAAEPAAEGGLAPVTTSGPGVEDFFVVPAAEAYEGVLEAAELGAVLSVG